MKKFSNLYLIIIYLFLYFPIFIVVLFSFNASKLNINFEGFTLEWYGKALQNKALMEALRNSLIVAVSSTIMSTIIGTMAAVGMKKYTFAGKKALEALLYVPIVIPEIVLGIALLSYFNILKFPLGLLTLILAHTTFCIPFVIHNVKARLAGFDHSVEEASMDLGANRFQTFMKVTLPIIMPGVTGGAMLAFSLSLDDLIISFFVTGPESNTLPLKLYSMVKVGLTPDVNALASIMLVVSFILMAANEIFSMKRDKVNGIYK